MSTIIACIIYIAVIAVCYALWCVVSRFIKRWKYCLKLKKKLKERDSNASQ